jgi:putative CocE/NonD family hydrolase
MNEEKAWRELSEWPSLQDGVTLYLGEDGHLSESFQAGQRGFRWSPADPTPSKEGPTLFARTGRGDMRSLASRDDVLSFTGSALDVPLDLLGQAVVEVDVSADAPAHDLFVCFCDVRPDGISTNISDGYMRLPRGELEARRNIKIPLLPMGWRVHAGHRLQLLVAGGAFPRYARHLGRLDQIGSGTSMRDVNVTLHTGPGCRIHLPVDRQFDGRRS